LKWENMCLNVFSDPQRNVCMEINIQGFVLMISDLVRGWAKKMSMTRNSVIPANSENLQATIGIVNVKDFVSPVVGIPDIGNPTPHSYLFISPRQEWPDLCVKWMKYLIEKAKSENKNKDDNDNDKEEEKQFEMIEERTKNRIANIKL